MRLLVIGLWTLLWLCVVTAVVRPLARAHRLSYRHFRRAAERVGLWPFDAPLPWEAGIAPPAGDELENVIEIRQAPIRVHRVVKGNIILGWGNWPGARNAWRIELSTGKPPRTIPYADGDEAYLGLQPGELDKRRTEVRFVEVRSPMVWVYFAGFLLLELMIVAWGMLELDKCIS